MIEINLIQPKTCVANNQDITYMKYGFSSIEQRFIPLIIWVRSERINHLKILKLYLEENLNGNVLQDRVRKAGDWIYA